MSILNKNIILTTLIQHETLTIEDLLKKENLGFTPNISHLQALLIDLKKIGHIDILNNVEPVTYTITQKGIDEALQLKKSTVIE